MKTGCFFFIKKKWGVITLGILSGILSYLFGLALNLLDAAINGFLGALGFDLDTFEQYFPAASQFHDVIIGFAVGLLFIMLVFQLFRNFGVMLDMEAEDPLKILGKTALFFGMIVYSRSIIDLLLGLMADPYAIFLNTASSPYQFELVTLVSAIFTSVFSNPFMNIVAVILMLVMGWQFLKLTVECVERYVVFYFALYCAPVVFATGAFKSTAQIFKSWCRLVGSQAMLLQLFHTLLDHYNTEELSLQDKIDRAFKMRLAGNNLDEMCTADYACPDKLDFRHARYVVIDGVYHAYLHIPSGGYKWLVGAAWLSPLINAGEAIDVDLFLHKMPSDRMQVQVGRNLRINKAKISEVSTTSADYNKMGDIMESGYYLQRGLNDGQEFFYLNVLVTVKAFSKKDLENRVSEVIKMMTAKQITLKYCAYMQERAFLSTLPLAKLDHKLYQLGKRNVLTNTAASTYMFTSFEICDESGVLLGTNEHNNSLVVLDLFNQKKYKNPHLTILGTTGSGKTHTLQCLATRMRRKHVATYVIAPLKGHEFVRAAKAIGGQFIRISTGSPHCINVMEIRPMDNSANELLDGEMEEQSYLSMKIDSLLIFFSIIMPEMTNIEEQLLDEALVKTYADFGITNDNKTLWDPERPGRFKPMPILGDLYKNLKRNPKAERLAIVLNRFVNGSARSFNGQTNVDLSNPYTVIDLSYLKKKLLSAGMFIATDLIWDLARQNRLKQKAIVIDEVWQLIGSNSSSQAAEYLVEMAKIGRAYNTAILFASQDINDFFSLEGGKYGKAIISNSKTKIVLNLEPHEAEKCGDFLYRAARDLHKIKNFDRGHGLLSSNGNNIAVHFQASALENSLITTDPEELRRIAEEKQRKEHDDETPPTPI